MTAVLPPHAVDLHDYDVVSEWLHRLHGQSRGYVWIGSNLDFRGRAYSCADPDVGNAAARYVSHLEHRGAQGIYCRTTSLRTVPPSGRGGDNDSLTLPGLAADLDIAGPGHKTANPLPADPDAASAIIDESGLPDPSLWIHSGGGLYAWWLLDKPWHIDDLPRAKRLSARWQDPIAWASGRLGYSYGRLGDLARILRIPGTVNRKPAMPTPMPCRIVNDTDRRYSLDNLRGCLIDALAAMPQPEPPPARFVPRVAADGVSPGDDYEARTDWSDLLRPHGWTLAGRRGNTRYWCRPGKDRREGHSASTGKAADRDRIWVFTDATVLPQGQPLTKFAALAWLEHGGNFSAAAKALVDAGYGNRNGRAAA